MNIGFYIKWNKGSLDTGPGNVIGDELLCLSMIKYLCRISGVHAELYAPNFLPKDKIDIMIYMNDTPPDFSWAVKHVLYMQNAYTIGGDVILSNLTKQGYDGFVFYSNKLLQMHIESGGQGIFLPFGVDTEEFYPLIPNSSYMFDCAYVGNDIKGKYRTERYIMPALNYNFGLFGNWPKPNIKYYIKRLLGMGKPFEKYQISLGRISQGKIPQKEVPLLYSSAKIILNCTIQDCVDMDVITLRVFEVLACKGFLITDKVPLAEKYLHNCVVFTEGRKELDEQIAYYLEHPEERAEIAENGYLYVQKYASMEMRMNELYAYLVNITQERVK
jgi:spore maturation protein CgeB